MIRKLTKYQKSRGGGKMFLSNNDQEESVGVVKGYYWPHPILGYQIIVAIIMALTLAFSLVFHRAATTTPFSLEAISLFCIISSMATLGCAGLYLLNYMSYRLMVGLVITVLTVVIGLPLTYVSSTVAFHAASAWSVILALVITISSFLLTIFSI